MPNRVSWPVKQWPAADQAAWTQAQQRGNPMIPAGKAAKWRPASYKAAIGAYGRFLAYLADIGFAESAAMPAAGVTAANMRRYVGWLQLNCATVTVSSYVAILCMMAQTGLLPVLKTLR